jgi:CheY-like chemotaxis protein
VVKNVVLIDSDSENRRVAEFALREEGYEVTVAADGLSGLEMVRAKTPCVVILELLLPKLHGFAVCKAIRDDFQLRRVTQVVVVSNKSYPADIRKALELGAVDFLVKPLSPERFVEAVRKTEQKVPIPQNELARLAALEGYRILDTKPEQMFDDLTMLASYICETPVALVSLVDADRQWFKSKVGTDLQETSRELAFCAHAIMQSEVFVVPDAQEDERFKHNTLVRLDPKIRFYAGAPITAPAGEPVGTLCVIDLKPRQLTPDQVECLKALSRQARVLLEARQHVLGLQQHVRDSIQ